MMYNISVAEKRVVSKEKQFLEVFCISRDNKVLSKCSYCPSHYLCSDLLSIWLEAFGRENQILMLAIIKTEELEMLSHIKVNPLGW